MIQIQPTKDAMISSIDPNSNYGSTSILQTYYYPIERKRRILLSFDIPELSVVTNTNLWFYQYTPYSQYIDIHILQKDFVEMETSWNKAYSTYQWITPGGDYDINPIVSFKSVAGWNSVSIPITIIQIGLQTVVNILMKLRDEIGNTAMNAQIISKDSTPTSPIIGADLLKPYLEINTDIPCPTLSAAMEVV